MADSPIECIRLQGHLEEYVVFGSTQDFLYGNVHRGFGLNSGDKVAVKMFFKDVVRQCQNDLTLPETPLAEVFMAPFIQPHKNLHSIREAFEDDHKYYVISDFADGSDLLEFLRSQQGGMPEYMVRYFVRQIVAGLYSAHTESRIAFQDFSLENCLLFVNDDYSLQLKICDPGQAVCVEFDPKSGCEVPIRHSGCVGKRHRPPEVFQSYYDQVPYLATKTDSWTLGWATLYLLNTDELCVSTNPLDGDEKWKLISERKWAELRDKVRAWNLSDGAWDFIIRLCDPDPVQRMSIGQAMEHSWLQLHTGEENYAETYMNVERLPPGEKRHRFADPNEVNLLGIVWQERESELALMEGSRRLLPSVSTLDERLEELRVGGSMPRMSLIHPWCHHAYSELKLALTATSGGVVVSSAFRLDYSSSLGVSDAEGVCGIGLSDRFCSLAKPCGYSLLRLSSSFRHRALKQHFLLSQKSTGFKDENKDNFVAEDFDEDEFCMFQWLKVHLGEDDHHAKFLVQRALCDVEEIAKTYSDDMIGIVNSFTANENKNSYTEMIVAVASNSAVSDDPLNTSRIPLSSNVIKENEEIDDFDPDLPSPASIILSNSRNHPSALIAAVNKLEMSNTGQLNKENVITMNDSRVVNVNDVIIIDNHLSDITKEEDNNNNKNNFEVNIGSSSPSPNIRVIHHCNNESPSENSTEILHVISSHASSFTHPKNMSLQQLENAPSSILSVSATSAFTSASNASSSFAQKFKQQKLQAQHKALELTPEQIAAKNRAAAVAAARSAAANASRRRLSASSIVSSDASNNSKRNIVKDGAHINSVATDGRAHNVIRSFQMKEVMASTTSKRDSKNPPATSSRRESSQLRSLQPTSSPANKRSASFTPPITHDHAPADHAVRRGSFAPPPSRIRSAVGESVSSFIPPKRTTSPAPTSAARSTSVQSMHQGYKNANDAPTSANVLGRDTVRKVSSSSTTGEAKRSYRPPARISHSSSVSLSPSQSRDRKDIPHAPPPSILSNSFNKAESVNKSTKPQHDVGTKVNNNSNPVNGSSRVKKTILKVFAPNQPPRVASPSHNRSSSTKTVSSIVNPKSSSSSFAVNKGSITNSMTSKLQKNIKNTILANNIATTSSSYIPPRQTTTDSTKNVKHHRQVPTTSFSKQPDNSLTSLNSQISSSSMAPPPLQTHQQNLYKSIMSSQAQHQSLNQYSHHVFLNPYNSSGYSMSPTRSFVPPHSHHTYQNHSAPAVTTIPYSFGSTAGVDLASIGTSSDARNFMNQTQPGSYVPSMQTMPSNQYMVGSANSFNRQLINLNSLPSIDGYPSLQTAPIFNPSNAPQQQMVVIPAPALPPPSVVTSGAIYNANTNSIHSLNPNYHQGVDKLMNSSRVISPGIQQRNTFLVGGGAHVQASSGKTNNVLLSTVRESISSNPQMQKNLSPTPQAPIVSKQSIANKFDQQQQHVGSSSVWHGIGAKLAAAFQW